MSRDDNDDHDTTDDTTQASILIVDDVLANLVSLEAVLAPLGHHIVRASSGEEALKRILTDDFAVVLLDVQMPGLDGFETAALIKTHPRLRSTPIIFITAISRDSTHVFRGYEHGAEIIAWAIGERILTAQIPDNDVVQMGDAYRLLTGRPIPRSEDSG